VKQKIALIASQADWGTSAITDAYRRLLEPEAELLLSKGFRKLGPIALLNAVNFITQQESLQYGILALFNAPVLLSAIAPRKNNHRRIGILDWTEAYPVGRRGPFMGMYNKIYRAAFNRLDITASPVMGFRSFYNTRGCSIRECRYPLPYPATEASPRTLRNKTKLLFIGADYERKGGDELLHLWSLHKPKRTELTFVCPKPPIRELEGVKFAQTIKTGSNTHKSLFEEHDVLLLPSRNEPFGYVALEAINHGMVVVITENSGCSHIVRESGGLVGATPEESIAMAFTLCESWERIATISHNVANYAGIYEKSIKEEVLSLFAS